MEFLSHYLLTLPSESIGSGEYNHAVRTTDMVTINGHTTHWVIKWPKAFTYNSLDAALNDPERIARKLRMIHPHMPVYAIKGYRLLLVFKPHETADSRLLPNIIYVHAKGDGLAAAVINWQGIIERHSLDHIDPQKSMRRQFDLLKKKHKTEDEPEKKYLSPGYENLIFHTLGYTRQALLLPYIEPTRRLHDTCIANNLLDIYRRSRNIVMDACSPGNFIAAGDEVFLVDADQALDRSSPLSLHFFDEEFYDRYPDYWTKCYNLGFVKTVTYSKLLVYIESYLAKEDINNEFITPYFLQYLDKFYERRLAIDASTLNTLLKLLKVCRTHGISQPKLSVDFVQTLRDSGENFDKLLNNFIVSSTVQPQTTLHSEMLPKTAPQVSVVTSSMFQPIHPAAHASPPCAAEEQAHHNP